MAKMPHKPAIAPKHGPSVATAMSTRTKPIYSGGKGSSKKMID